MSCRESYDGNDGIYRGRMRTAAERWGPQVEPACVMVFMTVGEMEGIERRDGEARWRDSQMQRSPFEEDGSEGVVTADEGQSPRAGLAHEV